jgi:hypothetical protein
MCNKLVATDFQEHILIEQGRIIAKKVEWKGGNRSGHFLLHSHDRAQLAIHQISCSLEREWNENITKESRKTQGCQQI